MTTTCRRTAKLVVFSLVVCVFVVYLVVRSAVSHCAVVSSPLPTSFLLMRSLLAWIVSLL